MNILESIMAERRDAVADAARATPLDALKQRAADRVHHSLVASLSRDGTRIISEMKKASPSAGLLRPDYQPAAIGALYQERGAAGISILTEPKHFLGSGDDVCAVREIVDIPILRKDFMCDAYQVWEAAAWGADVILLIVAALERSELMDLHAEATAAGLDVLVESHTAAEIEIALELDSAIIGVNSRNLKTLETDLQVAVDLAAATPSDRLRVAESGIKTRDDIKMLLDVGYNGFLIGEALMAGGDPSAKLSELIGKPA